MEDRILHKSARHPKGFSDLIDKEETPKVALKPYERQNSVRYVKYQSRREKDFNDSDSSAGDDDRSGYKDTGAIMYKDTNGNETVLKPNFRFLHYKSIFQNLLVTQSIITRYPIVSMIISYDSTRAIAVTKNNDREYYIRMYSLQTYELTFTEKIGGG